MSKHTIPYVGPVHLGTTIPVFRMASAVTGTIAKEVGLESDSCLISLWVGAVTGSISVTVSTMTEEDKEILLMTFPTVTSITSQLILKKASLTMGRIIIRATIVGTCSFDVDLKAISSGDLSTKVVGANIVSANSYTATNIPTLLVPSSLIDRAGIIVKHFGTSGTLFLGFSMSEATLATGYPLGVGESLAIDVAGGQEIYAITSGPTINVRTITAGG